jgi:hypothetical protein
METKDNAENRMEGNPKQRPLGDTKHNSDGRSPTEVLETMRNLIFEL